MMCLFSTLRFDAGHDVNGNPLRAWVVFQAGRNVAVYDEGYAGLEAITDPRHRAGFAGETFPCTADYYRTLINVAGEFPDC